jgi:mono/diheme cytochrome c family protein
MPVSYHLGVLAALMLLFPLALLSATKHKKAQANLRAQSEGARLFRANCAMCHNADSTKELVGPGLRGLFKNKVLPKSHLPATEGNVRRQIENGNPNAQPMGMPGFKGKLTAIQIEALIAYLKTL